VSAVAHLGHERPDIRIGGIQGLEMLAASGAIDAAYVGRMLCAFIRGQIDDLRTPARHWSLPLDVKLALSVHFRLQSRFSYDSLDLSRCDLSFADLTGAPLAHVNLAGATLDNALLRGASLEGSDLDGASFRNADLTNARLRKAYAGADFTNANLTGATLSHCVTMEPIVLAGANLTGADLSMVVARCDLRGATLTDTLFWGCSPLWWDVRGTDFRKAIGMSDEYLTGAHTDDATKLPGKSLAVANEEGAAKYDPTGGDPWPFE
jgi:uncharacterized protein YjbI with pentapeptide repeats